MCAQKKTWGKTLEQCAPARVTRGGLPLPTVVELAGKEVLPPVAVEGMETCFDTPEETNGKAQSFLSSADGKWRVQNREGRCLIANSSGLYTAACAGEEESGKLTLSVDGQLKASSGGCVTANCSLLANSSGLGVACSPGARLSLETCVTGRGSVRQQWAEAGGRLLLVASNDSTAAAGDTRCRFSKHTDQIKVSPSGGAFTVTSAGGNANAVGPCVSSGKGASLSFSITYACKQSTVACGVGYI